MNYYLVTTITYGTYYAGISHNIRLKLKDTYVQLYIIASKSNDPWENLSM